MVECVDVEKVGSFEVDGGDYDVYVVSGQLIIKNLYSGIYFKLTRLDTTLEGYIASKYIDDAVNGEAKNDD